jgi:hypothetical protein
MRETLIKSVEYHISFGLLTMVNKMALMENKNSNQGSQYGIVHSPPWVGGEHFF